MLKDQIVDLLPDVLLNSIGLMSEISGYQLVTCKNSTFHVIDTSVYLRHTPVHDTNLNGVSHFLQHSTSSLQ